MKVDLQQLRKARLDFMTLVSLLCATSVFSVSLWWFLGPTYKPPQRHREHRGCTEKSPTVGAREGGAQFRLLSHCVFSG
jgi:hypothetical protein